MKAALRRAVNRIFLQSLDGVRKPCSSTYDRALESEVTPLHCIFTIETQESPRAELSFSEPLDLITAETEEEVDSALDRLAEAQRRGYYTAGLLSYELGYALEPRLRSAMPANRKLPLLSFGVFAGAELLPASQSEEEDLAAYTSRCSDELGERDHQSGCNGIKALIAAGDIYQANFTFRSHFRFVGDPLALYRRLRRRAAARHCAYIDDGSRQLLSLSPELFFFVSPAGQICMRPMKGTAARGRTPLEDEVNSNSLQISSKDRAENLMIVDLVRNDIGRIAARGSVHVPELFRVETYPTLHQMVSTVKASLKEETKPREIIRALFPCGSVTGAPKIRAMQVIREFEQSPRGAYCGAIGYFAPDGSAQFNVAIRTITICAGHGELGIGSAIVWDSESSKEYAECLLKAAFFTQAHRPIELLETLRWEPRKGFIRLNRHLARLSNSATAFGIPFDRDEAVSALTKAVSGSTALAVRLRLQEDGRLKLAISAAPTTSRLWKFTYAQLRTKSGNQLLQHKTSWRDVYEQEYAAATGQGFDETVFLNERGEVTEGSRTNVFVMLDNKLFTPPAFCGLLSGVLRQELIDSGVCSERRLCSDDLERAEAIYLGNSLRGLTRASLGRARHHELGPL